MGGNLHGAIRLLLLGHRRLLLLDLLELGLLLLGLRNGFFLRLGRRRSSNLRGGGEGEGEC